MAQADLNVANQSGAAFRSDLNGQLLALGTLQSGSSAPSTTFAYMLWADTATGLLKIRDAANTTWITVGTLASTNLGLATLASPTFTGTPAAPTASVGTNTTQLATTAYVVSQAIAKAGDTMTGDLTVPSLNSDSLAGTRSRIINAGMVIDQRNSGSSISSGIGAVTYTVDRWYVFATTAAVTAQRVASSNSLFTNALRITGAASNAGVSVGQRIEVQNSYDMANRTVTLSFYAASSASVTLTWKIFYAGAANNFTTKTQSNTGTQNTTSTLTKYSATFTLPSAATTGIAVEFSVASLTSGTIDLTGVQLELGSVATPTERRSFGEELMLCQRYYHVNGSFRFSGYSSSGVMSGNVFYPCAMRAAPTWGAGATGTSNNVNSLTFVNASTTCIGWDLSPAVAGMASVNDFTYTASAEL